MKAMMCTAYGPPESLKLMDVPSPPVGKGQVRVAIHASGVNFPDTLIIQGKYQFKPDMPFAPGHEVAGDVVDGLLPLFVVDKGLQVGVGLGGGLEGFEEHAVDLHALRSDSFFLDLEDVIRAAMDIFTSRTDGPADPLAIALTCAGPG